MGKEQLSFTNSTRPDVLKLNEHFKDMESLRGSVIEWKDLEGVIGVQRDDNRFKTVLSAWRRQLKKEVGVWTRADLKELYGVGMRVLTHDEQIHFSGTRYRQAGRRIVDGHAAAANTDDEKLSEQCRKEKEFRILAGRHLHAAVIESRRFLPKVTNPPETKPAVGN